SDKEAGTSRDQALETRVVPKQLTSALSSLVVNYGSLTESESEPDASRQGHTARKERDPSVHPLHPAERRPGIPFGKPFGRSVGQRADPRAHAEVGGRRTLPINPPSRL
ncbi:Nuclear fragile X mental retardation-interacting protein 1, partial [Ophiophagus hannah]